MFLFLYNYRIKQEHFVSTYSLSQNEINKLKDGDIILRRGFGMVSDLIVTTMNEEYDISHCAIIVKDNNHFKVIHTVSQSLSEFDGVQSQTLSRFISDSKENSIIVVRLKGISDSSISQRAKYFLSKKIPFDHDFDINDSSKLYCTELIWKVIKDSYKIDIFENQLKGQDKKNQYRFSALMDSNRFDIIINHHLKR
jgi:uncharacterized protein YycO